MRKLLLIIIILIFPTLTACAGLNLNRTEIDKTFVVRIVAIDKLPTGKIRLTITSKSASAGGNQGEGTAAQSEIMVSEGETVFDAARQMLTFASKRPHYGHTEFILFGENTARDGIIPFLDFISRNHEFRYNAKIYIVKGDSANGMISKVNLGDSHLSDKLVSLESNAFALSQNQPVTLSEAMYIFDKKGISTYIPYIEVVESNQGEMLSKEQLSSDLHLSMQGYAIFKEDKLQSFLDGELSRGVNWIRNEIKSGILVLEALDGQKISMEIINSKSNIKPYMDENRIQCTVSVKFDTNIAETMSKDDIFTPQGFTRLEELQETKVRKEIEKTLKYAQELNLDIFGIITNFVRKYPNSKEELRASWNELFPEIQFNVEVESLVNRTYLIRETTGNKK